MAGSKNQTARYYLIDECLQGSRKYWSKKDLIEKIDKCLDISITERTLDNDIYNMRYNEQLKYNAPIEHSKKNDGYYYTEENYSIRKLALNETDIQALEFATSILSQYKDISIFNDFTGAVDKVLSVVSMIKKKSSGMDMNFVDFEKAPYCKGTEYLDLLFEAIHKQKVLDIHYQKFTSEKEKVYTMHPYLLKEYRNRWYLLGLNDSKNDIITLGLDRITKVEEGKKTFVASDDFDANIYFKNTLGITYKDEPVEEITLSFSPSQGAYLKTQPLHETQEIISDDNKAFVLKLYVIPNYELCERILGYGKDVKVLEPASLKKHIAKVVSEIHDYYSNNS